MFEKKISGNHMPTTKNKNPSVRYQLFLDGILPSKKVKN